MYNFTTYPSFEYWTVFSFYWGSKYYWLGSGYQYRRLLPKQGWEWIILILISHKTWECALEKSISAFGRLLSIYHSTLNIQNDHWPMGKRYCNCCNLPSLSKWLLVFFYIRDASHPLTVGNILPIGPSHPPTLLFGVAGKWLVMM